MLVKNILVACCVVFSLAACSSNSGTVQVDETISAAKASIASESSPQPTKTESASPTSPAERTEVIWADYDPGTQGEIDRMTNAGDCLGINSFFGMATATEESVKARTGHGNEALTKYLNESLEIAKCS